MLIAPCNQDIAGQTVDRQRRLGLTLQLDGRKMGVLPNLLAIVPDNINIIYRLSTLRIRCHENCAIIFEEIIMIAIDGVEDRLHFSWRSSGGLGDGRSARHAKSKQVRRTAGRKVVIADAPIFS